MQKQFLSYLVGTCHGAADKKYLLAVSGGLDSVVMTCLFHTAGIDFAIAHCNFRLRGAESDNDQLFVKEMADRLNRKCFIKEFDTAGFAKERGISVQMAARDLRYAWFEELAIQQHIDYIAVGHNRNDMVETALLNFARSTGIRGLSGISPQIGKVIRPLLFATRGQIEQFARLNSLHWREDSSNADIKYHRNRIRHAIIPVFESINPAFMQNAAETINRLAQTEKLLDHLMNEVKQDVWTVLPDRYLINIEKLKELPASDILLFELLREFGISQISMESILSSFSSIPGKQFHTRTHCITRDRSELIITRKVVPVETQVYIGPETALVSHPVHLTFSISEIPKQYIIPSDRSIAVLDAEKVGFPLLLRSWKEGDKFRPLGLGGSKKVSDFLINLKVPRPDKQHIWILETGGKIAWIINHRIDDRFRITNHTRKILLIEYKE
jgi:tRNA(Ile)-lysidine synthase